MTQAQLDALYDGKQYQPAPLVRFDPHPENFQPEVEVSNGGLSRAAITYKPSGTTVEAGYLGLGDSRNTLISQSPYVDVKQEFRSKPDSWIDYRLALGVAYTQLKAQWFGQDGTSDPQIDAFANQLSAWGALAGGPYAGWQGAGKYTTYDNNPQTTNLYLFSSTLQAGRAYSLFGPMGLTWALTGKATVDQFFPNAAGDASVGPYFKLGGGNSLLLTGGETVNASPIGNQIIQGFLSPQGHPGYGLNLERAPHAGLEYRGPVPGEPGMSLKLGVMRQWNELTTYDVLRGALSMDVAGKPMELGGQIRHEAGPSIEYDRLGWRVDATRHFTKNVAVWGAYQRDDITYGNVPISNGAALAGLKIDLGGGDDGVTGGVSVTQNFSPQDTVGSPPIDGFGKVSYELDKAVSNVLNIAEQAQIAARKSPSSAAGDPNQDPKRMRDLATTLQNMPQSERDLYRQTLLAATSDPAQQAVINQMFSAQTVDATVSALNQGANVLEMLADNTLLEKFATRVLRNRMLYYIDQTDIKIPVIDKDFRWTPATFMAAVNVLQGRPSPIAPITSADETALVQPWLWKELAMGLHLDPHATPEQIGAALVKTAPPALQPQLQAGGTEAATALVAALSDLVRKELNTLMINSILASEQLDRLHVDGNKKPSEVATDFMETSIANKEIRDARQDRKQRIYEDALHHLKSLDRI